MAPKHGWRGRRLFCVAWVAASPRLLLRPANERAQPREVVQLIDVVNRDDAQPSLPSPARRHGDSESTVAPVRTTHYALRARSSRYSIDMCAFDVLCADDPVHPGVVAPDLRESLTALSESKGDAGGGESGSSVGEVPTDSDHT